MRLRHLVVVTSFAALAALGGCASTRNAALPAADLASAERALHARSDALQAAESAMDATRATSFWTADAVMQGAGMPAVVGRDNIAGVYRQFFTAMNIKELRGTPSHVEMAKSGDLAYETGVNRIVFRTPNGDALDMGKYLLVWKKVDGEWYAAALSFTSDAPAPVPMSATR